MVEDNNETTMASKSGKVEPVVVHENNNGTMKLADTRLKPNNTLGTHIAETKEEWFMNGLTIMMCGIIIPIHLQKRMNWGVHTR